MCGSRRRHDAGLVESLANLRCTPVVVPRARPWLVPRLHRPSSASIRATGLRRVASVARALRPTRASSSSSGRRGLLPVLVACRKGAASSHRARDRSSSPAAASCARSAARFAKVRARHPENLRAASRCTDPGRIASPSSEREHHAAPRRSSAVRRSTRWRSAWRATRAPRKYRGAYRVGRRIRSSRQRGRQRPSWRARPRPSRESKDRGAARSPHRKKAAQSDDVIEHTRPLCAASSSPGQRPAEQPAPDLCFVNRKTKCGAGARH